MQITEQQIENIIESALDRYQKINQKSYKNILFSDWIKEWLEIHKLHIEITTYFTYKEQVTKTIVPYFVNNPVYIEDLTALDVERFYYYLSLKGVSNNTILKYHANIYSCMEYAATHHMVSKNVVREVVRPKKTNYVAGFYTISEMENLLLVLNKKPKLKVPVIIACLLGLRRGEIIGLKWDCINFANNTIEVGQKAYYDKIHKKVIVTKTLKTVKSRRVLKLPEKVKEYLMQIKEYQDLHFKNPDNFVCLDEKGKLLRLDYLSRDFPIFLVKNNFRRIRFHDLRHSCASMLIALGVPMKDVQEWLGHADYATTSNIYAHLYSDSKNPIANKINNTIKI